LIGNLGADPEVRTTTNGSRVASFSVATSRQWTTQGGEKQEKTEWHRCVAWNSSRGTGLADTIEKYVKKGDRVYVEGRIEYRTYEDKEKQTRYVTEINVRELVMLSARPDGAGGADQGARRAGAAPAAGKREPEADKKAGDGSFDDFPGALDEEDDDLPF
jgi:single-strand DNA-binding protein